MSCCHTSLRRALALGTALGLAAPALAQTSAAPPGRVGQITGITGNVSYNGAASNGSWIAATDNYPLVTGDSLFTQSGAQAAIALDASRLTLAPETELQVTALGDEDFAATESQGELFLDLTALQPGQSYSINTPRGAVTMNQAGMYDIEAGDTNGPTVINVLSGSASAGGTQIPAGQALYLSGTDQTTAQLGDLQRDDFVNAELAALSPPPPPYAPPAVQQMTGVAELSTYGSWAPSPQYGAVWYPNVGSGWAPYQDGHWAYVPPWGWTWVEAEPWGFAPFHYGRWAQIGGRWGWVPAAYADGGYVQVSAPPVYAPAVVGFFGIGLAAGLTFDALAHGSIGWVPLGPGEPYYPHYHADPAYIQRINRIDVRNINVVNIHNTTVINNYVNRNAAYYAPASVIAHGQPVRSYGHPMTPQMFAQARPVGEAGHFNQAIQPQYQHHAAPPPHPTAFAARKEIPPAQFNPGAPRPAPAMGQPQHPGNAGEAPHAPAMAQPQNRLPQRPEQNGPQPVYPQPQTQPFHAQEQPQAQAPTRQPAEQPRPPVQDSHAQPQASRPAEQPYPQMPQVHSQAEQPRPQVQQFHPQAEQPRPQAQPFHPPAPPPAAHPEEQHPQTPHPEAGAHGEEGQHQHP